MAKLALQIAQLAGALLVVVGLVLAGVDMGESLPARAQVYVAIDTGRVYAPSCVTPADLASGAMKPSPFGPLRDLSFKLDPACLNAGGFEGNHISYLRYLIFGLQSRWDEDGRWRW